jgi:hypothetical protein
MDLGCELVDDAQDRPIKAGRPRVSLVLRTSPPRDQTTGERHLEREQECCVLPVLAANDSDEAGRSRAGLQKTLARDLPGLRAAGNDLVEAEAHVGCEVLTGAVNAALHRTQANPADLRSFCVAMTFGADEDEDFTL